VGGIALGVAQSLGASVHSQGFLIAGHLLFLAVMLARLLLDGRPLFSFFKLSR